MIAEIMTIDASLNSAPGEKELLHILSQLGIAWSLTEHDAVFTVEASMQLHKDIDGLHTKNLFLKDAGGQFWLITAPHDARVDLKVLPSVIGSKKLSFGKAEDMERLIGVFPGAVTPLAAFNDRTMSVSVVMDARLAASGCVNVHPLRNTATVGLSGDDLIAFIVHTGHKVQIAELPAPL